MPQKPRRRSKGTARSLRRRRTGRRWLVIQVFIIAVVGFVSWVLWMDYTVRTKFEGVRWALPARVYARPLELYAGLTLSAEEFILELNALGYRQVQRLTGPGEYRYTGSAVDLIARGFAFWDGIEPSKTLHVRFNGRRLVSFKDPHQAHPLTLVRLEPIEIGKIYPNHNEDRVLVRIKEVPSKLLQALIAVEDRGFYRHRGIDPKAIARALLANIRAGRIRQGGSTLTQQLVKNFYLSEERTITRKFTEVIMALLLERRYSKDEILEVYLNEIYLGQEGLRAIHGFGLAAHFYFGVPLNELKIHQFALLAALARGASYYDPRKHPERALKRRNHVLAVMIERGLLGADEGNRLMHEPLGVMPKPRTPSNSPFPAFMDLVRRQLARDYDEEDLRTEGLQIFTTLDPQRQFKSEQALAERLSRLEKQRGWPEGRLQGAVVVTGTETGEVLALVGDRDPRYAGFNRALNAKRPIGSLVKPAIYLTALTQPERYDITTTLNDTPLTLKNGGGTVWVPRNYSGTFYGAVPLHRSLAQSYNLATVRLGMDIGVTEISRTLRELGVEGTIPAYPSLFLGAIDLSPLEVGQMYQTLASGGFYTPLRAIREVLTAEGKPLQRYGLAIKQVIEPAPSFLINYLLTEVVKQGTARALAAELPGVMPLAGKTGTTNDLRDSWFAGFGSDVLAVVWVGRDDNQPAGLSGASGAMRVWSHLMKRISPSPLQLTPPTDIEWRWIDRISGRQTDPECPGASAYPFMFASRGPHYEPCTAIDHGGKGLTETQDLF